MKKIIAALVLSSVALISTAEAQEKEIIEVEDIMSITLEDAQDFDCLILFDPEPESCQSSDIALEAGTQVLEIEAIFADYIIEKELSLLVLDSYYASVATLHGQALEEALKDLMSLTKETVPYGDARYILQEANADIDDPNLLRLAYTHELVPKAWDAGVTWQREHVFPVSRLGVSSPSNSNNNISSDLHNLLPASPAVNISKSNHGLDSVQTSDHFVITLDRGLSARILFYMSLTYDELTLDNTLGEKQMSRLDTLVLWHKAEPPDAFEMQRNDVIEAWQGNRNPFIDYPLFWDLLQK